METKVCSKCKVEKSIEKFHKKGGGRIEAQCKECKALYDKQNREAGNRRNREYRARHRERVQKAAREKAREKYHENPKFFRKKRMEEYYRNHNDNLKRLKQYRESNPEYFKRIIENAEVCYVAALIRKRLKLKPTDLKNNEIPPELIDFERQLLKLNRFIKNIENGKSESEN